MQLAQIRVDDIVRCDVRGHRFLAFVHEKQYRSLSVEPITPGTTWRSVTANQVIEHWSKRKRGK